MPMINLHTPADNHVYSFLDKLFKRNHNSLRKVGDNCKYYQRYPGIQDCAKFNTGPRLILAALKGR
jgi:hypothetical protein